MFRTTGLRLPGRRARRPVREDQEKNGRLGPPRSRSWVVLCHPDRLQGPPLRNRTWVIKHTDSGSLETKFDFARGLAEGIGGQKEGYMGCTRKPGYPNCPLYGCRWGLRGGCRACVGCFFPLLDSLLKSTTLECALGIRELALGILREDGLFSWNTPFVPL